MTTRIRLGTVVALTALLSVAGIAWARKASNVSDIQRGRYLIVVGSCNDCHTPRFLQEGMEVPEELWLTGLEVGFQGPWGTSYGPNLRLLLNTLTEDEWLTRARRTLAAHAVGRVAGDDGRRSACNLPLHPSPRPGR